LDVIANKSNELLRDQLASKIVDETIRAAAVAPSSVDTKEDEKEDKTSGGGDDEDDDDGKASKPRGAVDMKPKLTAALTAIAQTCAGVGIHTSHLHTLYHSTQMITRPKVCIIANE
jgi:hypothetical protein